MTLHERDGFRTTSPLSNRSRGRAEIACGSKESDSPFPVSPCAGESRGGRVPPTPEHAARPSQKRWHASCAGSPHKRAAAPLCIPRLGASTAIGPGNRCGGREKTIQDFNEKNHRSRLHKILDTTHRARQHHPYRWLAGLRGTTKQRLRSRGHTHPRTPQGRQQTATPCSSSGIAAETLAAGNPSRRDQPSAPAVLPRRIHFSVQSAKIEEQGQALLPPRRASPGNSTGTVPRSCRSYHGT